MALPQEKVTTNLPVKLTSQQVEMMLKDVDTAGLSEEDRLELAAALWHDYQKSAEATDYRPQRIKIVKETQMFADSMGASFDELRGVMIARQKTRGLWLKGSADKRPLCSSLDGRIGRMRREEPDGSVSFEERRCKGCPYDEFGSGVNESGEKTLGKACKEMRRIYIQRPEDMFPSYLSLPPTSLKIWDDFVSGRLNAGISDLKAQVVLTLQETSSGKFSYSVIRAKTGPVLKPAEILEFARIKKQFEERLLGMEVEAEDYYGEPEEPADDAWEPPEATAEVYRGKAADLPEEPAF